MDFANLVTNLSPENQPEAMFQWDSRILFCSHGKRARATKKNKQKTPKKFSITHLNV